MIRRKEMEELRRAAFGLIVDAGFPVREEELDKLEVADFGLSRPRVEGAQILTLVDSDRIGVKVIALLPHQTLPEHWHPPVGSDPGKEETVRAFWGELRVYVAGNDTMRLGTIPEGRQAVYSARHELSLPPGAQYSFSPGTKHWFQAGRAGAVLFSFSSVVRDILDGFTDPSVRRSTEIVP